MATTLADIKSQVAQAACFKCLSVDTTQAAKTYLLALLAGGSTDPKILLGQARGFFGIPSGMLAAVQAGLVAVAAGLSTDPLKQIQADVCAGACLTVPDSLAIQLFSLAQKVGLPTDPKIVAKLAACFVCIPSGLQEAVQAFLLAVIAGVIPAPAAITPGTPPTIPTGPAPTLPTSIMFTASKFFPLPPPVIHILIGEGIFVLPGGGHGVVCPPMKVGDVLLDTFESYTTGQDLNGQHAGTGWCDTAFYVVGNNTVGDAWANLVVANGGTRPSQNTIDAANDFDTAIGSIKSRIYHANIIAPDNLVAALTPFIATYGSTLWTKHSVGVPPAESITINGLKSATNDTNGIVYDTGIAPSGIAAFTLGNQGLSVYCADAVIATSNNPLAGCFDSVASSGLMNLPDFGGQFLGVAGLTANGVLVAHAAIGGFYMISRSAVGSLTGWFANSGNAWGSIGNNAVVNAAALNTEKVGSGGLSRDAAWTPSAVSRVSFMAIHDGFTSADGQTLFNAVQALRTKIGGGFV